MKSFIVFFAIALLPTAAWAGSIIETIELPGVQSTRVTSTTGLTTETFDGFATGRYTTPLTTAIGTVTAPAGSTYAIVAASEYGGAGGTGNFFAIGAESGGTVADLALDTGSDQTYAGFWLSALDGNNSFAFYENSTLIQSFDAAEVKSFINSQPNATAYYGNPNSKFLGDDSGEPFAYLNFFAPAGTAFNKVVFSNAGTGTGLELDNLSIAATYQGMTGTPVQATPLPSPLAAGLVLVATLAIAPVAKRAFRKTKLA